MNRVVVFEEQEFGDLRMAIAEAIITKSKSGYGVRFISRDPEADNIEMEDVAMYGHLLMCIDTVWPR